MIVISTSGGLSFTVDGAAYYNYDVLLKTNDGTETVSVTGIDAGGSIIINDEPYTNLEIDGIVPATWADALIAVNAGLGWNYASLVKGTGCIVVNRKTFASDKLFPQWDDAAETLCIQMIDNVGGNIPMKATHYTQIYDRYNDALFASYASLKSWLQTNFFDTIATTIAGSVNITGGQVDVTEVNGIVRTTQATPTTLYYTKATNSTGAPANTSFANGTACTEVQIINPTNTLVVFNVSGYAGPCVLTPYQTLTIYGVTKSSDITFSLLPAGVTIYGIGKAY